MVTDNLEGTFFAFLNVSNFDTFPHFITFFRSFYILQIVCMVKFTVKSVKVM